MPDDLRLPEVTRDGARFAGAVRALRDHLVGAVDVDREIRLNGQLYVVAWAERRPAEGDEAAFSLTSGLRVAEGTGNGPAEIVRSGEEQITLAVDGERFVFHLVEADEGAAGLARSRWRELRGKG